jgi:hypothetical protein
MSCKAIIHSVAQYRVETLNQTDQQHTQSLQKKPDTLKRRVGYETFMFNLPVSLPNNNKLKLSIKIHA